jgi:hypothetical protein
LTRTIDAFLTHNELSENELYIDAQLQVEDNSEDDEISLQINYSIKKALSENSQEINKNLTFNEPKKAIETYQKLTTELENSYTKASTLFADPETYTGGISGGNPAIQYPLEKIPGK